MPAFSFKERFCPWVKDGSKPGTIRAFRKYPVRVGQLAHLYFGMRTKYCTKLATSPEIIYVECIYITKVGDVYFINTNWFNKMQAEDILKNGLKAATLIGYEVRKITLAEKNKLAWKDGFRHCVDYTKTSGCFDLMLRYWCINGGVPFIGFYTKWGK